ncbi:hypothetical protein CspHIS471_0406320 [Cutaneotrichosporon sp. HIS471]|nr:hypothetical protein CspHIS471_0406320 [Cutaneotrichosporon sp. HIS471]
MSSTATLQLPLTIPVPAAILALVAVLITLLLRVGRRDPRLPPGPPTTPVLGNLTTIPPRYAHLYFLKLSKQYGDVISLKLFNSNMVVLNSAKAIFELLDKRSSSFNDRAPMYINDEVIARGNHILIAPGKRNAVYRKAWNRILAPGVVGNHVPLQTAEGSAVLYNLLKGVNFYQEMRRYSCSLTLAIAFGKRAPTFNGVDSAGFSVKEFYRLEHAFNFFLEVGAAPPIDLLPVLKYLPGPLAPWKAKAQSLREEMRHYYHDILFGELKRRLKKGQCTDAWLAKLVKNNPDGLSDECLAWNGGVMLEGGSDTTSGALLTFILAACCFPDKAAKAREEIDRVVGHDRSPVLEDITNLPYCDALVKEMMRWRPVAPAGVPHLSTKDEVYRDMLIPAGTLVVGNTWAALHDPELYDEPEEFRPERFLANKYGLKEEMAGWRNTLPYGAGRRICLGTQVAENSLSINIPKLLWAFDFEPVGEMDVNKFEPGHLTAPVEFKCHFRPRNSHIEETIISEYEEARELLSQFEFD